MAGAAEGKEEVDDGVGCVDLRVDGEGDRDGGRVVAQEGGGDAAGGGVRRGAGGDPLQGKEEAQVDHGGVVDEPGKVGGAEALRRILWGEVLWDIEEGDPAPRARCRLSAQAAAVLPACICRETNGEIPCQ